MKNSLEISNSHAHEWPALRLGLAAEIAALAAELEQTQWYSRKQLEANQMRQLRQLLTFVVKHSAFYGEVFASSGVKLADLAAIDGLQNLPLLRRQRIQGAGDDFFCREVPGDQGKVAETQTSGSTGEPVRIKKTGITELFLHTYSLRIHQWADIPFNSRLTTIRANHREHREIRIGVRPSYSFIRQAPLKLFP